MIVSSLIGGRRKSKNKTTVFVTAVVLTLLLALPLVTAQAAGVIYFNDFDVEDQPFPQNQSVGTITKYEAGTGNVSINNNTLFI